MSVRAKFKCTEKTPDGKISMETVYDPDPQSENGLFFKWTPYGQLSMGTVNENALAQFEVGKEYYLDFTKTE